MTAKLTVYNEALGHLGERKIASLAEAREPRRVLDDYWDGTLKYCLEQGFWNFAMRAIQADSSASITPTFGFTYAFTKPTDWIRTFLVSANEGFEPALLRYEDEPNLWYADSDPLFVKYVSNDSAYGGDLSIWPETFADFVALRLARQACKRITESDSRLDVLRRDERKALADAKSKDAMNESPKFPPKGTWVTSRSAGMSGGRRWNGETV